MEKHIGACARLADQLGRSPLAPLLRLLPEQLSLQRKDVVEHAVDAAPFQSMLGHDACTLQLPAQRGAQPAVHPNLPVHLRLLDYLQAPV